MFWALWAAEAQGRRLAGGRSGGMTGGAGVSFASLRRFWAVGGEEELVVGAARSLQAEAVEA